MEFDLGRFLIREWRRGDEESLVRHADAVRAVSEHIFATLDACRIFATVFESNPASGRVLEKAGFVLEGRLRKAVTKSGKTIDALMYAAVREDDR